MAHARDNHIGFTPYELATYLWNSTVVVTVTVTVAIVVTVRKGGNVFRNMAHPTDDFQTRFKARQSTTQIGGAVLTRSIITRYPCGYTPVWDVEPTRGTIIQ